MAQYLVTYDAVVARAEPAKADEQGYVATVTTHNPLALRYYMVVTAASLEAVNDQVVNYTTPGFVSKVSNVVELGGGLTVDELAALLRPEDVLKEQR